MKNTSIRKVRSTCESVEEHTSPRLFQRSGVVTNTSHHRGPVRSVGYSYPSRLLQDCPSIAIQESEFLRDTHDLGPVIYYLRTQVLPRPSSKYLFMLAMPCLRFPAQTRVR